MYEYLKALHLIFVVTWFAGLFYIVRLFVYQTEVFDKSEVERQILQPQYKLMAYRLWYIITWPSAVLASIFAFWMLFFTPVGRAWLETDWMQVKLGFVALLYVYQLKCHQIYLKLQRGEKPHSSNFLRLWNEVATLILFAVVFLVVLKNAFNWIFGVVGIIVVSLLLMLGFKFYKNLRAKRGT